MPSAEDLLSRSEFEAQVRHNGIPKEFLPSRRLIVVHTLGVLTGLGSIIAGVALIYWPAALIVAGLSLVLYCALLVDVGPKLPKGEPR